MSTPMPGRSTAQNVASQAQRAAPGLRGGSRPGLGPTVGGPPVPSAPISLPGALAYYGAMNVGAGALVGTPVGPSSSDILVFQDAPTDDFRNGAAATWSSVDGEFTADAGGYWALLVDVTVGSVGASDVGYLELIASSVGNLRIPMFNNGSSLRGSVQIGPAPAFPAISTFSAKLHFSGSVAATITGAQATFWPTGLFPEVA